MLHTLLVTGLVLLIIALLAVLVSLNFSPKDQPVSRGAGEDTNMIPAQTRPTPPRRQPRA